METIKERIYTLTNLNQSIENLVTRELSFRTFWIKCQIAKINSKGGHLYLELMDSVNGEKTAVARGIIWRLTYEDIQKEFGALGLRIEEVLKPNMEITVQVKVNFHKLYGLSLHILKVDPNTVIGDIEQQKRETLQRLTKEGLLEMQKRLYLGPINLKIGIVGSPDTSGFNDFLKELKQNSIFTRFEVKIFEASVQGAHAVRSITAAIEEAGRWNLDALVVIRGGGSKMDLHVFNHYDICKAIAYSRIPVLVGIGHETDQTLADIVAYHSEKTPTAVAKYFYLAIGIFKSELNDALARIRRAAEMNVYLTREETQMYQKRIFAHADHIITGLQQFITGTEEKLRAGSVALVVHHKDQVALQLSGLFTKAMDQLGSNARLLQLTLQNTLDGTQRSLQSKADQVNRLQNKVASESLNFLKTDQLREVKQAQSLLALRAEHLIQSETETLRFIEKKIDLVHPNQLFSKGYTISTVEGKDLRSQNFTDQSLKGKTMTTFAQGARLESTITKIIPTDD